MYIYIRVVEAELSVEGLAGFSSSERPRLLRRRGVTGEDMASNYLLKRKEVSADNWLSPDI